MPFISIRVITQQISAPVVEFVNAGANQNVLCNSIVELQGLVAGVPGTYLVEWEQISGTPVTLENADTLSPWFVNPNTTDLVFRLWVDRYTPNEQFSDVSVFRNPAADATNFLSKIAQIVPQSILSGSRFSSETRQISSRSEPTPFLNQDGDLLSSIIPPTTYSILWESIASPSVYEQFLGVEVEIWDDMSADWVVDAVRLLPKKHYIMAPGQTYRLVVLWYDVLRHTVSRETDNKIFVGSDRPEFPRAGISDSSSNLLSADSIKILEQYLIQRSITESVIEDLTNIISEAASTKGDETAIMRASGTQFSSDITFPINFSETGSTMFSETTITRAGGISIGS